MLHSRRRIRQLLNIPTLSLLGLAFLLIIFLLDRGGIHLTSYFLFAAATTPFLALSWLSARKNGLRIPPYLIPLFFFLLFTWLSWLFSHMKGEGIRELLSFTAGAFLFFALLQIKFSAPLFRKCLIGLFVIGGAETLYAFYTYIFGPFNRLAGTFHDYQYAYAYFPNAFANFSLALIPAAFYFLWMARSKKHEIFAFILLVFSLAALILTYSRGAFLSLVFTAAIFFGIQIVRGKFRDTRFWLLIFKATAAMMLSFFVVWNVNFFRSQNFPTTSLQDKIVLETSEKTASVDERLNFWKGSLPLIGEQPIFGFGPYSFQYVFPRYQKELLAISDHPHNMFFKIGVENGAFALASFVLFLGSLALLLCRRITQLPHAEQNIAAVIAVMVAASLIHNSIDYNVNFLANFLILWAGLGFLASFLYEKKKLPRRVRFLTSAGAVFIAALFIIFATHEAYYGTFYKAGRAAFSEKKYTETITAYEKAEPLWLKRRLLYDTAVAYFEQHKKTGDPRLLEKESELLTRAMKENPFDAFLIHRFAERVYAQGKITASEAISYYEEALRLDSFNNLAYYFHLLSLYADTDDWQTFFEWEPRVSELLDRYSIKLRENEHLTVLTDNPRYAFKIYELFERYAAADSKRQEYEKKKMQIREFFLKKYDEMVREYGIEVSKEAIF